MSLVAGREGSRALQYREGYSRHDVIKLPVAYCSAINSSSATYLRHYHLDILGSRIAAVAVSWLQIYPHLHFSFRHQSDILVPISILIPDFAVAPQTTTSYQCFNTAA
jgi:hypothetical protein